MEERETSSIAPPGRPRIDGERLLARRRRRIQLIRKRAIAGSVAAFGAAWAVIGYQLVSGHDPALGNNGQAAASTRVAPATKRAGRSTTKPAKPKAASTKRKAATPATTTGATTTGSATSGSTSTGTGSASTGSSSTGSPATAAAPQPAPVTTRQS